MRPTGLLSVTFRNLPFEQIIDLTVQAGLDGIEWGGDVHVPPGELKPAERIGQAAREADAAPGSHSRLTAIAKAREQVSAVPSSSTLDPQKDALGS